LAVTRPPYGCAGCNCYPVDIEAYPYDNGWHGNTACPHHGTEATAPAPQTPVPPATPSAPVADTETGPCTCWPDAHWDGERGPCDCSTAPVSAQQDEMDVPYGRPPVCPTCAPGWARVADDCGHHLVGLDCQLHGPVNHGSPCDGNHIPDADGNPVCTPVGPSPEETCSFPACAHEGCICPGITTEKRKSGGILAAARRFRHGVRWVAECYGYPRRD
jgi:hypothetical protein